MAITDDFTRLEIYEEGPFQGLLTPAEFAELQRVDESAVRHAIKSGRLIPGKHCFKFGKQWVLCKEAFPAWHPQDGYSKPSILRAEYLKAKKEAEKHTIP